MSLSKLKIDLGQGTIEAEGDTAFVAEVYRDFKDRLGDRKPRVHEHVDQEPVVRQQKKPKKKGAASPGSTDSTAGKRRGRDSFELIKDLDLTKSKAGRLKDFIATFSVKTNFERNLIFIYFMQQLQGMKGITEDHVFTCYRALGVKVPKALRQSLFDTSGDRGWINTSDMKDIRLTIHGINHLEHDLPKAVQQKG